MIKPASPSHPPYKYSHLRVWLLGLKSYFLSTGGFEKQSLRVIFLSPSLFSEPLAKVLMDVPPGWGWLGTWNTFSCSLPFLFLEWWEKFLKWGYKLRSGFPGKVCFEKKTLGGEKKGVFDQERFFFLLFVFFFSERCSRGISFQKF